MLVKTGGYIMKIDKISFGTNPAIDYIAARKALPEFNPNLAKGITRAFNKIAKNKTDNNNLYLNVGQKQGLDILELSYWVKDKTAPIGMSLQSTINLNPKSIEMLSSRKIKNVLLKTIENLKTSNNKTDLIEGFKNYEKKEDPQKHIKMINDLTNRFGCFFDLADKVKIA